jgi:uncharacterized protein
VAGGCADEGADRTRNDAGPRLVDVPACSGRALALAAGERVRIVDVEGAQVVDTWAFVADDPAERHSAEHTRVHVNRLFPRVGEHFVSNRRRPILRLEEDDSPGIHDMLCAACDPARYAALGVRGYHASCAENFRSALDEAGIDSPDVPQPINLFMNIPLASDGSLGWEPAPTQPGDSVVLRADVDLVLVVSACPQDVTGINGAGPTGIRLEAA